MKHTHANDLALVFPLQCAATRTEEAVGRGLEIGPRSQQGPEFGAFGGNGAPAAVGEISEVIGRVLKLMEETIKNSRKGKTKSINIDDGDDIDADDDDAYCCVSDQALVEYATCTVLPLLDATLRRYTPHLTSPTPGHLVVTIM